MDTRLGYLAGIIPFTLIFVPDSNCAKFALCFIGVFSLAVAYWFHGKKTSLVDKSAVTEKSDIYNEFNTLTYGIFKLTSTKLRLLQNKKETLASILNHKISSEITGKQERAHKLFQKMTLSSPKDVCQPAQEILKILILCDACTLAINKKDHDKYQKQIIKYRDLFIKSVRHETGKDPYAICKPKGQ